MLSTLRIRNLALVEDLTVDFQKGLNVISGETGAGKSVCLNTIIASLLVSATPDQVQLLMIDPKRVELTVYNGIPHLIKDVITDARMAAGALFEMTEADLAVLDLKVGRKPEHGKEVGTYRRIEVKVAPLGKGDPLQAITYQGTSTDRYQIPTDHIGSHDEFAEGPTACPGKAIQFTRSTRWVPTSLRPSPCCVTSKNQAGRRSGAPATVLSK